MDTIVEPSRTIPILAKADITVCGGGPAGAMAALAAADQGARVVLVEHHGFLGGTNSASGVTGVGGWQYDLDGCPLIDGLPLEFMDRVCRILGTDDRVSRLRKPIEKPDYRSGGLGCFWIRTNPEIVKLVLDRMMIERGVKLYLHSSAVRPIQTNRKIQGVFIENKSGRGAILSDVVIDCTGDGDIAAAAGASYIIGRTEDAACQPMSAMFIVANADMPDLWYGDPERDPQADPLLRDRYRGAIRKAREKGDVLLNPNDLLCSADPLHKHSPNVRHINFTRIQRHSAVNADEITQAEMEGRAQIEETIRFLQKYIPGCEKAHLVSTPPKIGIRESRRITGDYVLTGEDVRNGKNFPDTIARGIYLLDIHNLTEIGEPSTLEFLDGPYSIPYRSLLPKDLNGIIVAGRCISGDHTALASYRIQSHCMAMGQAAGIAAALAADRGIEPRAIDQALLHRRLVEAGANIGPEWS